MRCARDRAGATRGPIRRGAVALVGLIASMALGCEEASQIELDFAVPTSIYLACEDPTQCLSITASWCVPESDGSVNCSANDVDLTLHLPGGDPVVGFGDGAVSQADGCVHEGDEEAFGEPSDRDGDGNPGPFSENVTCSPSRIHGDPPRLAPGLYRAEVGQGATLLDTGIVVVDVNVDGAHERSVFWIIDDVPGSVVVDYP